MSALGKRYAATTRMAAILALALATPATTASEHRPNVVLVMVDDLGFRDLGCYGHPSIRTPVLDALAADGVRLTDFHSGAAVCTPSRMALLTGAYPVRVGWERGVVGYPMGMRDGMSPDALTIADIFKSEGYATGISGKWHIGDLPETRPHRQGFDWTFYIPTSNNQTNLLRGGDEIVEQPFENRMLTRRFTDAAIDFINRNHNDPFFLYLPYTAPHFPVEAHPDWDGHSDFGTYGDVVEELDHCIGEILETLDALEIRNRTLVVFLSDNGPQKGQQASAQPYRGQKWCALEGGTRVPCIFNWPGVIPPGRVIDELASAIDLLPTLARACNIDWAGKSHGSPEIDGLDVWDTLLGTAVDHPRTELLFWHGMSPDPQAIRVGSWKLFFDRRHALEGLGTEAETPEQAAKLAPHRAALDPDAPNPPFLFNIGEDPGEITDRSADFPEKTAAMRQRADAWITEIRSGTILPIVTPPSTQTPDP